MLIKYNIFIRNESYNNEYRCPIVPKDIIKLKLYGFTIYIESSTFRCYTDEEYEKWGAILVNDNWINYNDCIIIGLKELKHLDYLNKHTHIYFSHTYKNQLNSHLILTQFKKSNSILYDLEYFTDNNKRLISFGYYAGIAGSGLGLLQYLYKINNKKISNLKYWNSIIDLYQDINNHNNFNLINLKICIIGNGKCSIGVRYLLNLFNLKYAVLDRNDSKDNLDQYDIIYNCINLEKNIGTWFNKDTIFNNNLIIVDISCDYNNKYNPIQIYNNKTTWANPIYSYNEYVDIIAIDNLPSLLPFESSKQFSSILIELLRTFNNDYKNYWKNNLSIYLDKINNAFYNKITN